jgi:hypothetical protein
MRGFEDAAGFRFLARADLADQRVSPNRNTVLALARSTGTPARTAAASSWAERLVGVDPQARTLLDEASAAGGWRSAVSADLEPAKPGRRRFQGGDALAVQQSRRVQGVGIGSRLRELEGLVDAIRSRHVRRTMKGGSGHRIRALFAALVLALGMSLSVVQGDLMAAEMAVSADAGHAGSSDCDGCGGSDHKTDAGMCLSVCGSVAHGLVPAELVVSPPASRASFRAVYLLLDGLSNSPDHGPPKTLTFG